MKTFLVPTDFSDTSKNAARYAANIAKQYKDVFYCALHGWGGADMVNLFDSEGRKLTDPRKKRRPIAPRIQRGARLHGANYGIPFSGFHMYQREDSAWANALIPELGDYLSDAQPGGPKVLPAFVRVNAENGEITEIAPPKNAIRIRKPEEFGDYWSDPMTAEDAKKIDAYFRAREHLAESYGFVEVTLGGKTHTVDLNREMPHKGIGFEAPRTSFMTCIDYEIFDDLLIGNFMKTTFHGVESLYPDFSPYVCKYADNGGAKSKAQLSEYFLHYFLRAPVASALKKVTTGSEDIVRALVPNNSGLFKSAKQFYYRLGLKKP
jgi:hypothetical protein